jgi:hypothetical protein
VELEFDTATEAGLGRMAFLLDTDAENAGIPLSALIDHEYGARQVAFRRRVQDSELTARLFTNPADLGQLVERSLRELAETWHPLRRSIEGKESSAAQGGIFISYRREDATLYARLLKYELNERIRAHEYLWIWPQSSLAWSSLTLSRRPLTHVQHWWP